MEKQTIYIIASVTVVILTLLWFGYRALRRYSCCGTCGCDMMTKKEREAFEARKGNAMSKGDATSKSTESDQ